MARPFPREPEIRAFIDEVESFYPAGKASAPVDQQRAWYDALCQNFDAPLPKGLVIEAEAAPHPEGAVALRRYRPGNGKETVVVYFHGGGFVVGGLDSHHSVCAEIAAGSGAEVVATDYRLAPEHRFPLALTDALAAVRTQGSRPVLVAGDSAGASLAAGVALVLRDASLGIPAAQALKAAAGCHDGEPQPRVIGQVLIYPLLGGDLSRGSYLEMAEAPGLTTRDVRYYRDALGAPEGSPYGNPLATPDCTGLPRAYITSAFFDPLRDDGRHYASRLSGAGVPVTFREEPQMVHAWLRARHRSPGAGTAFAALCRGIKALCENA